MSRTLTPEHAKQIISGNTEEIVSGDFVERPLVSICLIIYNHVNYVAKALDSVLEQEADFLIEVVIGDDASTDGTSKILDRYQKQHSDRIKILRSTNNLGRLTGTTFQLNMMRNLSDCRGKYIAMLEGDDYWTDPLKLQKQIDYLESHSEFAGSFHNAIVSNENASIEDRTFLIGETKKHYGIRDILLLPWFVPTASLVFRSTEAMERKWILNAMSGDYALLLALCTEGDIAYIDETMSVWRVHPGGITHKIKSDLLGEWFANSYDMFDQFDRHTQFVYHPEVVQHKLWILNGRLGEFEMLAPKYDGIITPENVIRYYNERHSALLEHLCSDKIKELQGIADLKKNLVDRLTDYGNKAMDDAYYRRARNFYFAGYRYKPWKIRLMFCLLATFVPCLKKAGGR